MRRLESPPPHSFGWKLYGVVMVGLTAAGLPTMRWTALETLSTIAGVVGLIGLLGHAWSVRLPVPAITWRIVAANLLALLVVNLVLLWRAASGQSPWVVVLGTGITLALLAPIPLALARYATRLRDSARNGVSHGGP